MPSRVRRSGSLGLLAVSLLVCTACPRHPAKPDPGQPPPTAAKSRPRKPAAALPPPTPTPKPLEPRLGTIRVIGAHGSFVLIDTASALVTAAVPVGSVLHCHPPGAGDGASTADLRVSPERRSPYVVADVIAGAPSVGDIASLAMVPPSPAASPEPVLPPSTLLPGSPAPAPSP